MTTSRLKLVHFPLIHLKSFGVLTVKFFQLVAGFNCHHRLHVRVRLFDSVENSRTQFVLSGTPPPNGRV
jgi:hypothetical protein